MSSHLTKDSRLRPSHLYFITRFVLNKFGQKIINKSFVLFVLRSADFENLSLRSLWGIF